MEVVSIGILFGHIYLINMSICKNLWCPLVRISKMNWASNTNLSPYHPTLEEDNTSGMNRLDNTLTSLEEDDEAILVEPLLEPV
jgi:hypothetical protein